MPLSVTRPLAFVRSWYLHHRVLLMFVLLFLLLLWLLETIVWWTIMRRLWRSSFCYRWMSKWPRSPCCFRWPCVDSPLPAVVVVVVVEVVVVRSMTLESPARELADWCCGYPLLQELLLNKWSPLSSDSQTSLLVVLCYPIIMYSCVFDCCLCPRYESL